MGGVEKVTEAEDRAVVWGMPYSNISVWMSVECVATMPVTNDVMFPRQYRINSSAIDLGKNVADLLFGYSKGVSYFLVAPPVVKQGVATHVELSVVHRRNSQFSLMGLLR